MRKYICRHCGKTVLRPGSKAWVKSYCSSTGKTVHLVRKRQSAQARRGTAS